MFDFWSGPYIEMWLSEPRRRISKPLKIHRATCPHCDSKLKTLYYSAQLDRYICKTCMDVFMGQKKEAHHDKTV